MSTSNAAALEYLRDLAAEHFWGTVALKFERGQIVHVRQEQNLKPSDLSGSPRKNNADTQH